MTTPSVAKSVRCGTVALFCSGLLGLQVGVGADPPHTPCAQADGSGPYTELIVYEGAGLDEIDFEVGPSDVERILGPAEGGSEHYLSYASSGLQICFCGERVKDFHFREGFRGRLFASGLGIASSLKEVTAAYGEFTEEKVVDNLCGWQLDRTLLVRQDRSTPDDPNAYKLFYYDAGLFFLFDDNAYVREFGVFRKTNFLDRNTRSGGGKDR